MDAKRKDLTFSVQKTVEKILKREAQKAAIDEKQKIISEILSETMYLFAGMLPDSRDKMEGLLSLSTARSYLIRAAAQTETNFTTDVHNKFTFVSELDC